jgi:hypothetical protein
MTDSKEHYQYYLKARSEIPEDLWDHPALLPQGQGTKHYYECVQLGIKYWRLQLWEWNRRKVVIQTQQEWELQFRPNQTCDEVRQMVELKKTEIGRKDSDSYWDHDCDG